MFLELKDCDGSIIWFILAHPDLKLLSSFLVVNHPVGTCSWVLKEKQFYWLYFRILSRVSEIQVVQLVRMVRIVKHCLPFVR